MKPYTSLDMETINPWTVESIQAFSVLKCPECTFDSKKENIFQHHAIENHPLSFVLFGQELKQEQIYEVKDLNFNWKETISAPVTILNSKDKEEFSHSKSINEISNSGIKIKEEPIDSRIYSSLEDFVDNERFENVINLVDKTVSNSKMKKCTSNNRRKQILTTRNICPSLNVNSEIVNDENNSIYDDSFTSEIGLNVPKVHEVKKPFVCRTCGYSTSERANLTKHTESVHEKKKPFKCPDCEYCCSSKQHLNYHINNIHVGKRPHKCANCDKTFKLANHLIRHNQMVHDGSWISPYKCSLCDQSFCDKKRMTIHIKKAHDETKSNKCEICARTFSEESELKIHIATFHEGTEKNKCFICGVKLSSKQNLKTHISAVHEGKTPFPCSICDKRFQIQKYLARHVEIVHEKKRPYLCSHCGSRFSTHGNLKQHVVAIHNKNKECDLVK